jgi:hypothetical protein
MLHHMDHRDALFAGEIQQGGDLGEGRTDPGEGQFAGYVLHLRIDYHQSGTVERRGG